MCCQTCSCKRRHCLQENSSTKVHVFLGSRSWCLTNHRWDLRIQTMRSFHQTTAEFGASFEYHVWRPNWPQTRHRRLLNLWLAVDLRCPNLGRRFGPRLEHRQLLCTSLIPTVEPQGPYRRYRSTEAPLPLCDSYPLWGPWYLTLLCPSYVKQVSALLWLRRFALSLEPWLASVWNITVKTTRTNMTIAQVQP